MAEPQDDLWEFATALYARPGVAARCLALQDEAGCDVLLILTALWQAAVGNRVDADLAAKLRADTAGWRAEVIVPLRSARRAAKPLAPALAGEIAGLELRAERKCLAQLAMLSAGRAGRSSAAPLPALADTNLATLAEIPPGHEDDRAFLIRSLARSPG